MNEAFVSLDVKRTAVLGSREFRLEARQNIKRHPLKQFFQSRCCTCTLRMVFFWFTLSKYSSYTYAYVYVFVRVLVHVCARKNYAITCVHVRPTQTTRAHALKMAVPEALRGADRLRRR